MVYLCIVVIEDLFGLLKSAGQRVQGLDNLRPLPTLASLQPTQHQGPQFLILVVLKLVECVEDAHGSLEVMNPDLIMDHLDEVGLEVSIPEIVLELWVESVA